MVAALPANGEEEENEMEAEDSVPETERLEVSSEYLFASQLSVWLGSLSSIGAKYRLHPHSLEIHQDYYLNHEC